MELDFKQISLLVLGAFALAIVIVALTSTNFSNLGNINSGQTNSATCVGVVHLTGDIAYSDSPDPASTNVVTQGEIQQAFSNAESDPNAGAILLYINSPGGSAAASKEIYDIVRSSNKPVVAYLGELAASGGYYAASAANYIVANPDTITGNIGARTELISYADLEAKLGIVDQGLVTGSLKDVGAPYRNATSQDKAILQGILDESFNVFKNDVENARGSRLNNTLFAIDLDGRPLGAKEALASGLIDQIGNETTAIAKAASLANMTIDPTNTNSLCPEDPSPTLQDYLSQLASSFGSGVGAALISPSPTLKYQYG